MQRRPQHREQRGSEKRRPPPEQPPGRPPHQPGRPQHEHQRQHPGGGQPPDAVRQRPQRRVDHRRTGKVIRKRRHRSPMQHVRPQQMPRPQIQRLILERRISPHQPHRQHRLHHQHRQQRPGSHHPPPEATPPHRQLPATRARRHPLGRSQRRHPRASGSRSSHPRARRSRSRHRRDRRAAPARQPSLAMPAGGFDCGIRRNPPKPIAYAVIHQPAPTPPPRAHQRDTSATPAAHARNRNTRRGRYPRTGIPPPKLQFTTTPRRPFAENPNHTNHHLTRTTHMPATESTTSPDPSPPQQA